MNSQSNSQSAQYNKDIVEFNDWMFQQHDQPTATTAATAAAAAAVSPVPMATMPGKDLFDSDASYSSSTWFEPLETILSSTTSSSTGSPISNTIASMSANNNDNNDNTEVKLENPMDGADSFEFTLNNLLTTEKLKQEFEDDADAEDAATTTTTASSSTNTTVQQPLHKRSNSIVSSKRRLTENQKQAHNRIEKRYRININTKIAKLQQIIPWLATEQTAFASTLPEEENGKDAKDIANATSKKTRLNKSMILEKAVDYILYLQNNERLYEMEVMRLKSELNQYKN